MQMLYSANKKFIFIHIQKTGGTSIESVLAATASDCRRHTDFPNMQAALDPSKARHLFAGDLMSQIPEEQWGNCYKFAFVRNPWSRLLSWYQMCAGAGPNGNPFMWFVRDNTKSFEDFLLVKDEIVERTQFNQIDYINGPDGRRAVDFVGRFENLAEDFAVVCSRLKITFSLPHVNRGRPVDFRRFYTSRTVELVARRFARDISEFGYSFE